MALQILIFIAVNILIFIFSRKTIPKIYSIFHFLTRNINTSIYLLSFVLLPGTIVHEISHFLMASVLLVRTGHLIIFPVIDNQNRVRAGSLEIGECDPVRYTVIGLAPIISGLMIIYFLGDFFIGKYLNTSIWKLEIIPQFSIFYFLSSISLTMFSSKKDLQAIVYVGPFLILIFLSLYAADFSIYLAPHFISKIFNILKKLNFSLILTAGIDFLTYAIVSLINLITSKNKQ